jgi:hypothetical protein
MYIHARSVELGCSPARLCVMYARLSLSKAGYRLENDRDNRLILLNLIGLW